ncbi:MAG: hypothetical protein IPM29_19425 [Planctomycetes bacterium]|nr:hypothetical protein [Planctomycetota bacterium]
MDLQDIWQEHRRFILGVLAGVVVFFAARAIIGSVIGTEQALRAPGLTLRSIQSAELFTTATRDRARALNDELRTRAEELRHAVAFVPGDEFRLDGKGDPDTYFPEVARRVRTSLLRASQEYGVELADRDLQWQAPVGREEIADTLVALAAIEAAAQRLLEAGETVRARDPEALGVQSIEALKYDRRGGNAAAASRRFRRRSNEGSDLVEEHRIAFSFRADVMTLQLWLESLRGSAPPLALAPELKVTPGDQVGDPVLVKGTILALTVRELQ